MNATTTSTNRKYLHQLCDFIGWKLDELGNQDIFDILENSLEERVPSGTGKEQVYM